MWLISHPKLEEVSPSLDFDMLAPHTVLPERKVSFLGFAFLPHGMGVVVFGLFAIQYSFKKLRVRLDRQETALSFLPVGIFSHVGDGAIASRKSLLRNAHGYRGGGIRQNKQLLGFDHGDSVV